MVTFDNTTPGNTRTPRRNHWINDYNQFQQQYHHHIIQNQDIHKIPYSQPFFHMNYAGSSLSSFHSSMLSPDPSTSYEQRVKLQMLEHPSVMNEMQHIVQKRIKQQQRLSSTSSSGQVEAAAPSLFVLLPVVISTSATSTISTTSTMSSLSTTSTSTASTIDIEPKDQPHDSQTLYHLDQTTLSQDIFRLHFLCDYSDYKRQSARTVGHFVPSMPPPPQLHVCDEENGYALNDLENFSQTHKMCLLSLLRVLQSSLLSISEEEYAEMKNINGMETHHHDHDAQTSSLLLLQRRIDIAIRYMLQFFSIPDLEYILQSPSDMDMEEFNNETLPNLQIQDFADSAISRIQQTSTVDGRILGPLTQRNTRASSRSRNNSIPSSNPRMRGMGFVQWLCPYHSQIHCQAETRETLKAVIGKNGGSCVEQERFAELHFKTRENAAEFYNLMVEYRCIAKLQIKIGWKNLTEEDLWNLAEVVNESDIGGLILDCNYDPESEEQEAEYMGQPRPRLSFKPLLGMLFSPNLASFALENFPGSLPVLEESNFTCSPESFTLQDFRRSNPSECKLPPFSNLRTLVLNRCGPEPKANRLMPLIRHCPLLTEIQLECDDLDTSIAAIRGIATNLTFLRLSESMWEGIDMRFTKAGESGTHSSTQSKSIIRSIGRKTKRSLDLPYDGVVEQFATCAFMNLWEQHQTTLVNIVTQNPGLHDIELMCEARSMDRLWRFLTSHYLRHQQTYIQQQQFEQMSLHQNQPVDTSESFLRLRLYDGTVSLFTITPLSNLIVMHGYTSQHRQLLQSLEDITTALCIGSTFDSPEQLALLQSEAEQEGGIRFDNLLWILSLNQQDDPGFLHQLRALLSTTSNFKTFTMRIYVMLFDIGNLIYLWNWVCGAAYLNEEHGRWIQACFEHSSQASYDQFNAATNEESKNDVLKHKYPNDDFHDDSHENNSMELSETVSHTPLHGIMRSYNLQLDEEHDLVLSSSHFYFSPMMNTSVTGARTALSYALTLTQK